MAFEGMDWQLRELSLGGLNQKADDRARPQPFLDIAKDVQYDELGGVQPRLPYSATFPTMRNTIFGGGTLSACRRLAVVNGELIVFTDTAIYSWNVQQSAWVLRSTHLAVSVDEQPRFVTTGDQRENDRAELSGTVVQAWTEQVGAFDFVFIAAYDKTTGAVLMAPATFGVVSNRPRLVALATKILLFTSTSGAGLEVRAIDPSDPATGATGAGTVVLAAANFNLHYDAVKAGTQDLAVVAARRVVTTSYSVFNVNSAPSVVGATKARTCDGPIAVATIADGTQTQVIRGNGTNIQGDLLTTSSLADVFTGQAIGTAASTTINQITVAYGAATTARAYWTSGNIGENSSFTDFVVKSNTVTTANAVGTQADFRHRLGIASRAFTYSGHSYVWLAFAQDSGASTTANVAIVRAQLQNTYFLYRDDNIIISQATKNVAGGFSATTCHLPGVALTSGSTVFSWCGTSRRRIDLGTGPEHTAFAARSPRNITFTFDSDSARRCARIGLTMYITGGIPLQYDGLQTAEVGFLNFPWYFEPQQGGAGAIAAGAYTWMATYGWTNAQGEFDRSTTATGSTITIAASKFVFLNFMYLNTTLKVGARRPSVDMWRTVVAAGSDFPFYKVTSQDPTALPGANNGFVLNDDTLDSAGAPLPDNFTDAILTTKEQMAENGAKLEYLAPPGASLIIETDTRLFLGGVTGDPDRVWYSRERIDGEVASFHDALTIQVPRPGGAMTALAIHNETLTVFRASSIYRLAGSGFNNLGQGANFGPAERVASDVGAISQESIATTPLGTIFKSSKGWYLLTPSWQVQYIGGAVSDYDSETVYSAHTLETQHQVRILTSGGRLIVWDYLAATQDSPIGQWFEWTVTTGVHAVMWQGRHVVLTATGPVLQSATYTDLTYGIDVETAWIKLAGLQSASACRKIQILGEYRSAFMLWIRVAYNYKQTSGVPDYVDSKAWTPSPTTVSGPVQLTHGPKLPKCEAIKVRITAVANASFASLLTTALSPQVTTSGTAWAATFTAAAFGQLGNAVTMSLAFEDGTPFSIDVRDHFAWDHTQQLWAPDSNNIGVRVLCHTGSSPTVAQLEAAITAGTALLGGITPDATPSKVVNASGMANLTSTASFTGGAFGAPTGEAVKLTSIGLEVGTERGLFRRLPAAQEQ